MRRPSVSSPWLRLAAAIATLALATLALAAPAGAAAAPTLVKDINPSGDAHPTSLTRVGNTLFFAANDGVHGVELWKTDGSAAGTKMVKNIRPYGKSSSPMNLLNVNGTLFFTANDGTHGRELWKSDGTKAGTVMVKDIITGPKDQFGGNGIAIHERPIAIGNRLFFLVDICCVGTSGLFVSDGTSAGTRQLTDYGVMLPDEGSVGAASGKFYFVAIDTDGEDFYSQLWVSNGTTAGTRPVPGSPTPDEMGILPAAGQYLYFSTSDAPDEWTAPTIRVRRTDGTAAGIKALTRTDELADAPTQAVLMNSRLYFNDDALWKTNGTAAGTKPISNGGLAWLTKAGGQLFFTRGSHLWKSDGAALGTKDMGVFGTQWPRELIGVGAELCFAEMDWDGGTWALWESDGTAPGTYQVRSFLGAPDELYQAAMGGRLFFSADDGVHGVELWSYTP